MAGRIVPGFLPTKEEEEEEQPSFLQRAGKAALDVTAAIPGPFQGIAKGAKDFVDEPAPPRPPAPPAPPAPPSPEGPVPLTGPPGADPPALKPQMVTTGTTTVSGGDTRRFEQMNDAEKAARQEIRDLAPKKEEQVEKDADAEREKRTLELARIAAQNEEIQKAEQAAAERRKALEETAARADAYLAQQREQYGKAEIVDYWAKKGHGARFVSEVLSGIGDFGARMAGRDEGGATKAIREAVERDYQLQKANIEKEARKYQLAKEGQFDARQAIENADIELRNKKVAIYERGARMREEALAKAGISEVDRQKDAKLLALKEMAAREEADLQKGLRETIEKRTPQVTTRRELVAPGGGGPPAGNVVYGPGGVPLGAAGTEKETGLTNAVIEGYTSFKNQADELGELLRQHGGKTVLPSDVRQRMNQLQAGLRLTAKEVAVNNAGTVDAGLLAQLEDMIPDATGWGGTFSRKAGMVAKLNQSQKLVQGRLGARLDAVGIGRKRVADIDKMIEAQREQERGGR